MTSLRQILCFCLFGMFSFHMVMAQSDFELSVYDWGVKEGLPHREVNDIVQDSLGFIWFGTPQGLTRFDGNHFNVFTTQTDSFLTNHIWRIYPERGGCFWLFPPKPVKDIDIWCPRTHQRTTFRKRYGQQVGPALLSEKDVLVSALDSSLIIQDVKNRMIWVFQTNGEVSSIPFPKVNELDLFAVDQNYWGIVDEYQIIEFDHFGRILQQREFPSPVSLPESKLVTGLPQWLRVLEEGLGHVYFQIQTNGEIRKVGTGPSFPKEVRSRDIPTIGEDLFILDELGQPKLIRPGQTNPDTWFTYNYMPRVSYLDRNGVFWVGHNFGLRAIEINRNRFRKLLIGGLEDESTFNAARGMLIRGQDLFVNLEHQGLVRYNLRTKVARRYNYSDKNWGHFGLVQLQDGRLLSGANQRIYLQQSPEGEFDMIETTVEGWSFYQINDRHVWMGSNQGLWNIDLQTRSIEPFVTKGMGHKTKTASKN